MPKILKRCHICQHLNARWLYDDPQMGRILLCYACWSMKMKAPAPPPPADDPPTPPAQARIGKKIAQDP